MRRYRRMVLIDRVIPFLAALVGLLAIAGAMLVQVNLDSRMRAADEAVAGLRVDLDALATQLAQTQPAATTDPDAAAAAAAQLVAISQRIDGLEDSIAGLAEAGTPLVTTVATEEAAAPSNRQIDPNWPTTDCIPLGTRFMAIPNEPFPICQSPAVINVSAITGDNVAIDGAGIVTETSFADLPGTGCTVTVFSAEAEGFAELRVTCT